MKASRKIKRGSIYSTAISNRKENTRGTSKTGNIKSVSLISHVTIFKDIERHRLKAPSAF